ncbi:MAG TPA: J domain-containing protein [Nitrospirae bacterium]|nr:J domain-containing protein [Nitrospirota bacterium]
MLPNNGLAGSLDNAHFLLKIDRRATLDEIKQSYRKAARLYHPDTGNGSADVEKFYQIVRAYNAIIDDRKIRAENSFSSSAPPPSPGGNGSKGKWFFITNIFRRQKA